MLYACKTYSTHGKEHCSQHRIDYDVLYTVVLNDVRQLISEAFEDAESTADEAFSRYNEKKQKQIEALKKQLSEVKSKLELIDAKMLKMYEDNLEGKISDEMLGRLTEKIQQEEKQLNTKIQELEQCLIEEQQGKKQHSEFIKAVQDYKDIKELTPEILHKLINFITVHETITDGKSTISIEINYKVKP